MKFQINRPEEQQVTPDFTFGELLEYVPEWQGRPEEEPFVVLVTGVSQSDPEVFSGIKLASVKAITNGWVKRYFRRLEGEVVLSNG